MHKSKYVQKTKEHHRISGKLPLYFLRLTPSNIHSQHHATLETPGEVAVGVGGKV